MRQLRNFLILFIFVLLPFSCAGPVVVDPAPDPPVVVKPDEPEEPDEPEQPSEPENPGQPDTPDEPDEPEQPEVPDEPERLPSVYVDTPSHCAINSKDNWVEGATIKIVYPDGTEENLGTTSIKGRGNTTWWSYPKKPYTLKLASKKAVLGMPKDKRWNLLANWMDRTDIRNDVAFEISRRTKSLDWTPRGEFVEFYLNGKHQGNYYLCEKIKISSDRVDAGDDGWIVELDVYYDEVNKFYSSVFGLPVNIKDPDEDDILPGEYDTIRETFNAAEAAVSAGEYDSLIEMDSFIDFWFVQELSFNWEPNHPKSTYMYYGRDGLIHAGPVWDFDWETFKPNDSRYRIHDAVWYGKLFSDPAFVSRVKVKWAESRSDFEGIPEYIDSVYAKVSESVKADAVMWPVNQSVNGDERMSVDDAVARMRKNYISRFNWLDAVIGRL